MKQKGKPKQTSNSGRTEIVLNRMSIGSYISGNIGHEAINMFAADSGKKYVYLLANGKLPKGGHKDSVLYVVNVRYLGDKMMEILSVAKIKEDVYSWDISKSECVNKHINERRQVAIIDKECYGGKTMRDIFKGCAQQDVYVTFEAEDIKIPSKPKYIYFEKDENDKREVDVVFSSEIKMARTSLKQYFDEGKEGCDLLKDVVENIWKSGKSVGNVNVKVAKAPTMLSIYGKQDSETAFSNALKYFIEKYPEIFLPVFNSKGSMIESVLREEKNIDIIVRTNVGAIIIENKILSDIHDTKYKRRIISQLTKYKEIIEKSKDYKSKEKRFYVLAPDYANIDIPEIDKKDWTLVHYSDIYKAINDSGKRKSDASLDEFAKDIERHTKKNRSDIAVEDLKQKFYKAIKG